MLEELFRIAKQRPREKRDVIGITCLKDKNDMVKVGEGSKADLDGKHRKTDEC